jgi:hypothetical protein
MTALLEKTLRSDRALASLEEALIVRAQEHRRRADGRVRRVAPHRIPPGRGAGSHRKVDARATREAEGRGRPQKQAALLVCAPGEGGAEDSLGAELLAWIGNDRYLGDSPPADLDRLDALRRFWERLHGLYRYEVETQGEMPLSALDLQEKGDEPR